MPFKQIDVGQVISDKLSSDPELQEMWRSSRLEYRILGELVRLRKERGLSQSDLAQKTGNRQQVISRIEKQESSPTLKTLCSLADALDVDIKLVPRQQ